MTRDQGDGAGDPEDELTAAMAELESHLAFEEPMPPFFNTSGMDKRADRGTKGSLQKSSLKKANPTTGNTSITKTSPSVAIKTREISESELSDLFHGRNAWKNISAVVRRKIFSLAQASKAQRAEIDELKATVASLSATAGLAARQDWVEEQLRGLAAKQAAGLELIGERVAQARRDIDLKADGAYLTSCLLTKANKSDLNAVKTDLERAVDRAENALRSQNETRWDEVRGAAEAHRDGLQMQLQEAVKAVSSGGQSRIQNQNYDENQLQMYTQDRGIPGKDARSRGKGLEDRLSKIEESVQRLKARAKGQRSEADANDSDENTTQRGRVGTTATREFNNLVRQVEKLAALQANMQQLMATLETRVSLGVAKDELRSLAAEKANKLSVANAIHRKANKEDMDRAIEILTERLQALEKTKKTPSSSGPLQRKAQAVSTAKIGHLRADLDRVLETVRGLPTQDQVGEALEKLAGDLKPQIENALLGLDQLRSRGASEALGGKPGIPGAAAYGLSGTSSISALEGRVRAATERCSTLQLKLDQNLQDIDHRLINVEKQAKSALELGKEQQQQLITFQQEQQAQQQQQQQQLFQQKQKISQYGSQLILHELDGIDETVGENDELTEGDRGQDDTGSEEGSQASMPSSSQIYVNMQGWEDEVPSRHLSRLSAARHRRTKLEKSELQQRSVLTELERSSRLKKKSTEAAASMSSTGPRPKKKTVKPRVLKESSRHSCTTGTRARDIVRERLEKQLAASQRLQKHSSR